MAGGKRGRRRNPGLLREAPDQARDGKAEVLDDGLGHRRGTRSGTRPREKAELWELGGARRISVASRSRVQKAG